MSFGCSNILTSAAADDSWVKINVNKQDASAAADAWCFDSSVLAALGADGFPEGPSSYRINLNRANIF